MACWISEGQKVRKTVSNSGSSNNPGFDLEHTLHLSTSIFASINC